MKDDVDEAFERIQVLLKELLTGDLDEKEARIVMGQILSIPWMLWIGHPCSIPDYVAKFAWTNLRRMLGNDRNIIDEGTRRVVHEATMRMFKRVREEPEIASDAGRLSSLVRKSAKMRISAYAYWRIGKQGLEDAFMDEYRPIVTGEDVGINLAKLRRLLDWTGKSLEPKIQKIFQLRRRGKTPQEIYDLLGLKEKGISKDAFYQRSSRAMEIAYKRFSDLAWRAIERGDLRAETLGSFLLASPHDKKGGANGRKLHDVWTRRRSEDKRGGNG